MRAYTFSLISLFSRTCWGTNNTFKWTSVSHTTASSSTNRNIGDYVAAGLGMSTLEKSSASVTTTDVDDLEAAGLSASTDGTSSKPTATASVHETQMSDSNSRSQIASDETAIITSAASVYKASGPVHTITNITNATTATDCWHSWLDYWSASSANQVTYEAELYPLTTDTKTELWEDNSLIPTTSWQSFVYTYTESSLATIYSDGYPVSVSVSYDTSTLSRVGWTVVTIWSSLSDFHTTFTTTWSGYSHFTTTRATTALPTPRCKLPAVVPECSAQWNSYINGDDWKYYDDFDNSASGYFSGTPDCTQAQITGDWCTSMAGFYFARETMYGQDNDVGWVSANSTSYFPASKSLAPGCSLGCQACSITGESVQLYYWPPATATLVEDGSVTATLTPFAYNDSSIQTVSIDGTILTSPTMYISYDILHAANSCGAVGKTYRNTILPLQNTNHLFSLEPIIAYHGYAQGFRTSSFNLADLIEPIPDTIYEKQRRCGISSISWIVEGGQRNGTFSCARTEPYAPIIGVPPEARGLDPAWESCSAWYGGLFDPPKALQPADAIAVPTLYSATTSPAATPKSTVDSGLPTQTSAPATTSPKPKETQTRSQIVADPTSVPATAESDKPDNDPGTSADPKQSTEGSIDVLPDPAVTITGDNMQPNLSKGVSAIVSIFLPQGSQVSDVADDPVTNTGDVIQPDQSKGVSAIISMFLPQGSQASGIADDPHKSPEALDPTSQHGHGVVITAGSEVYTALSSQGSIIFDGTPLANGEATAVAGQTISVDSGTVLVNGVPQLPSNLKSTPHGIFTVAGQDHTAVQQADGAIEIDGESYTFGAVTAVGGSKVIVASEGLIVGATTIPYAELPAKKAQGAVFTVNGHTYDVDNQSGSVRINGVAASVGDKITTNGEVLTVGAHAINVGGTTISLAGGGPVDPTATAAAKVIIAGKTVTAIMDSSNVVVAGTTLTPGQIATISGTRVSVASDGIVVGSSTVSFNSLGSFTAKGDDAVTVGGTIYLASTISDHSDAVLIDGQTLSNGGPAAIIHGQVITKGSNGISVIDPGSSSHDQAETVVTIDGIAYIAVPVSGHSGAVVLQGQTLSIGGSARTIAGHLVTEGSSGISVASSMSSPSDGTSASIASKNVAESSTTEQSPTASSEESSASDFKHGLTVMLLGLIVPLLMLVNL